MPLVHSYLSVFIREMYCSALQVISVVSPMMMISGVFDAMKTRKGAVAESVSSSRMCRPVEPAFD